ncbi:prolipoprotein diacylglyceryl transferase family protein [Elusimicrobiota bacterium]
MNKLLKVLLKPILSLNNYPVLFKWKNIYFLNIGLINALAAVLTALCAMYFFKRMFPEVTQGNGWIWIIGMIPIIVLVTSKVFHYFVLGREFLAHPIKHLAETAFYNQGGQLGILIGILWFAYYTDINFFVCFDIGCLSGCLCVAVGRMGCYSYGCCFGIESKSRFSVRYTNPDSKVLRLYPEKANIPLVPTQLISAAFALLLFFVMLWILSLSPKAGILSVFFIFAYNGFRVFIEKYRVNIINLATKKRSNKLLVFSKIILGSGLIYLVYVLWMEAPHISLGRSFSFIEYKNDILMNPTVIVAMLIVFFLHVLAYGIHYKKLGQHFQWKKS